MNQRIRDFIRVVMVECWSPVRRVHASERIMEYRNQEFRIGESEITI